MKRFPLFFAFLLLSAFLFAPYADASVIVTLKNGNTLTANSCRIEKNRIFLKYPVGEVEVQNSQVESLKEEDGTVRIFQTQCERQKVDAPKPSMQLPVSGMPAYPVTKSTASTATKYTEADRKKWLDEHPQLPQKPMTEQEKQVDAFVDKYFAASDGEREKMDKELDSVLNQLFDEDSETGIKQTGVQKK